MSSLNRDSTNSGCSETCLRLSVTMHRDTTRLKYFRTTIQFRIAHNFGGLLTNIETFGATKRGNLSNQMGL